MRCQLRYAPNLTESLFERGSVARLGVFANEPTARRCELFEQALSILQKRTAGKQKRAHFNRETRLSALKAPR